MNIFAPKKVNLFTLFNNLPFYYSKNFCFKAHVSLFSWEIGIAFLARHQLFLVKKMWFVKNYIIVG